MSNFSTLALLAILFFFYRRSDVDVIFIVALFLIREEIFFFFLLLPSSKDLYEKIPRFLWIRWEKSWWVKEKKFPMAKRLEKRRVNQGRGRINEIRIGQETHRVYEQWNIACNPNFFPTFIRSSENPFQVSLRTNYRVYLFPLHRPIFQPMKPASDESTRETFNLIKKPPNVSSGAVSRIRPRLSLPPPLQPCLLALFMPANYSRADPEG